LSVLNSTSLHTVEGIPPHFHCPVTRNFCLNHGIVEDTSGLCRSTCFILLAIRREEGEFSHFSGL